LEQPRSDSIQSCTSSDNYSCRSTPSPDCQPIHYNVIKHLGSGSFGEVCLITNPLSRKKSSRREIALKRINMTRLTAKQREEVEYEVALHETLTKSGDSHIVHCYGACDDSVMEEKHIFLEYIDGSDLFELAMNKGGVGKSTAKHLFRQLLEGLAFLHDLSVAHRDIKPENLLVDRRGNLKIADFGLADCYRESPEEPDRRLSRICGSYEYLSPQVLQNDYSGPKNDVWAAGCVLVVMLTGDLPWDRAARTDPNFSLWLKGVVPPTLKDIDSETMTIVNDTLEVDEELRPTAKELLRHSWLSPSSRRRSKNSDYYEPPKRAKLRSC
ncbi:kinase domain protein, partial [Oesophagostomum dentatum]